MSTQVAWQHRQRHCLAAMGMREWRERNAPPQATAEPMAKDRSGYPRAADQEGGKAPASQLLAWCCAASHERPPRLALVWSGTVSVASAETLLRDLARHLGAALPGQPQAVEQVPAAALTLVFDGVASVPGHVVRLPSLAALAAGDVGVRRQAWQALRQALAEQAGS